MMMSCAQTMSSVEHQQRRGQLDRTPNKRPFSTQNFYLFYLFLFDNYLTLLGSLWFLLQRSQESVLLLPSLEGTVLIA
jgi:hypothetical protein